MLICCPQIKIEYTEDKLPVNDANSIKYAHASYCSLNITEVTSSYSSIIVCSSSSSSSASNAVESETDNVSCTLESDVANRFSSTKVGVDIDPKNWAPTNVSGADASRSRSNTAAVGETNAYCKLTTSSAGVAASLYETRVSPSTQDHECCT